MSETRENIEESFVVKQPLKLYKSKRRRYVRVEISAPVTFAPINLDRPLTDLQTQRCDGTILNISAGGVLLICDQELVEGGYLAMDFELKDFEMLSDIAGKVKRVDEDGDGGYLVGIEFCPEAELIETFGSDNVGTFISSFDEKVKRSLLKHIFARKVEKRFAEQDDEE